MAKDAVDPSAGEDGEEGQEEQKGVGRFLYRLALAGVGGVVLAQEELSGLFSRKECEPSEEAASLPEESAAEGTSPMEVTVDRILRTLLLPTRGDVEELSRKIEALAERVEGLRS